VKKLIDNKVLTFRRNYSRVDILINRSCNAQGEGSILPLVIPYPEEGNKVWGANDISKANSLVLNDPGIASGKVVVESPSKGKNSKSDNGKSFSVYPRVMVVEPTPLKIPYEQNLAILP
jgi:hypothetical protein